MLKPRLGRTGLFASVLAGTFVLATVADISADAQDYNWSRNASWNRNRANWNGNGNGNSGRYGYGGYGAGRAAAWGAAAGTAAATGSTVYSLPAGCASYNGYYNCGDSWYQPSATGYVVVNPPYQSYGPPYAIGDSD